jgi:TolB-like protein
LAVGGALALCVAGCQPPRVSTAPQRPADAATAASLAEERELAAERGTIGVPPFTWRGDDPRLAALGYAIADLLVTDLSQSGKLLFVERARLGEVLRETDLVRTGRVDPATAPSVGKLLGAQRLLLGSLDTLPSGEFRLGVRVADVATGLIAQALDARAPATDLLDAEKAMVFRLFDALGVTLTPAERAAVEDARPAASLAALAAYGEGVEAELLGDRPRAYNAYLRAGTLAAGFVVADQRAAALKQIVQSEGSVPSLLPGIRPINAPVSGTVDRLNRPLDLITSFTRPSSGAGDPAFPSTIVTVVIQVRRP